MPRQILVHKQVNRTDKGARSCKSIGHMSTSTQKTWNNNCFYSTHEGQINTFLSWQIKMNNGGQERVIYSGRFMGNGMQFGRVVTWNGTNELLSAAVTFCGRWRDVRPLLIRSVIPQQSSEEWVCAVFGSAAAGPSISRTKKSQTQICTWSFCRAAVSEFIAAKIWISSIIHIDCLHAELCMNFYPCKTTFVSLFWQSESLHKHPVAMKPQAERYSGQICLKFTKKRNKYEWR